MSDAADDRAFRWEFARHATEEARAADWRFEQEKAAEQGPAPLLLSITDEELGALEIAPRETMLPWLGKGDIALVLGKKGHGKSWVTLGTAYALASGGKLWRWPKVKNPVTVLFVDGELLSRRLKERRAVFHGAGLVPAPGRLHWLTPDVIKRRLNLYAPADRRLVVELADRVGAEVVIFDNVSALYRADGVSTNGTEWFLRFAELQDELASKDVATETAVHLGKDPERGPRGTSGIIDNATAIVEVARPKNWKAQDGAKFKVEVTFTRDEPEGMEPFGVNVEPAPFYFSTSEIKDKEEKAAEKKEAVEKVRDSLRAMLKKFPGGVPTKEWREKARPMSSTDFNAAKSALEDEVTDTPGPETNSKLWKFKETEF